MESTFTGRLIAWIGVSILTVFVSLITIGIAFPWMICYKERWMTRHTHIDGYQLVFDGRGGQLFGNYIKWVLLTIVTLGIYSLWININLKRWTVKHTHHVELPAQPVQQPVQSQPTQPQQY